MNIDLTWEHPDEEQNAALELAMKRKIGGLTEFQTAEFIITADKSLWYSQAKAWSEKPPEKVAVTWQMACVVIVDIVDSGYNAEKKMWWDMTSWDKKTLFTNMVLLADLGMMLKQYRRDRMDAVSRGFECFIEFVLGKGWERRFSKILSMKTKETT